jgi:hypothetical protein
MTLPPRQVPPTEGEWEERYHPDLPTTCTEGHRIHPGEWARAGGTLLPCGCPATSTEGRHAEGLPPVEVPPGVPPREGAHEGAHEGAATTPSPEAALPLPPAPPLPPCPHCGGHERYTDTNHQVRCTTCFNHLIGVPDAPFGHDTPTSAPHALLTQVDTDRGP